MSADVPTAGKKSTFRKAALRLFRLLHRDAGHLFIGLTFVYALSGIAVNHIADWDPNLSATQAVETISPATNVESQQQFIERAVQAIAINLPSDADVFDADGIIEITAPGLQIEIDKASGEVHATTTKSRWFLRAANWLHLNRGKAAWTYVADFYAFGLLLLATTGVTISSGTTAQKRRAWIFACIGILAPIAFVIFSPQSPT